MAGPLWDLTFYINNDTFGKSWTVALNGPTNVESAMQQARELAKVRAALLGRETGIVIPSPIAPVGLASPIIEFIRVKDAKNPRIGQIFQPLIAEGGSDVPLAGSVQGGPTDNAADPLWTALSTSLYGVSGGPGGVRARYTLSIVGIPDRAVRAGRIDFAIQFGGNIPNSLSARVQALLDYLVPANGGGAFGLSGQDPAEVKKGVTAYVVNAGSNLVLTVPAHGYETGDKVRLSNVQSGRLAKVHSVTVTDANTLILQKTQVTPSQVPTVLGMVQRVQKKDGTRMVAFYPFERPPGGFVQPFQMRLRKRNPGRRYTGASFTQRRKRGT